MQYGHTFDCPASATVLDFFELHELQRLCERLHLETVGAREDLIDRLVKANTNFGHILKSDLDSILRRLGHAVWGDKDKIVSHILKLTAAGPTWSGGGGGVASAGGGGGGGVGGGDNGAVA